MRTTSRPAFASQASWSAESRPLLACASLCALRSGRNFFHAGWRALEQQREHRHEVRLAAPEAAVDEAPVLLAAVEDLLHVVEDAGQLLLDGRRDDVVVDELLDLVGAGVGLAQLDDEAHRPDVFGARKIEGVGDGLVMTRRSPRCRLSSSSRAAAARLVRAARVVGGGKRFFQSSISSRLGPSGPTSACSSAFSRVAAAASSRATSGSRRQALSSRPMRSASGTDGVFEFLVDGEDRLHALLRGPARPAVERLDAGAPGHLGERDEALLRDVELAAKLPVLGLQEVAVSRSRAARRA